MGRPSDYIVFDKNNNISNIIIIILVIKVDHSMCQRLHSKGWLTGYRKKKKRGRAEGEKKAYLLYPLLYLLLINSDQ